MSLDIDRRDGGSLKGSSYAKPALAFKLFHDVRLFLIPLLFIASLLLGGFANAPQPEGVDSYLVTRVIDGDTIQLAGGERVRYIGIDTPETVHPSKPVEHFGTITAYEKLGKVAKTGEKERIIGGIFKIGLGLILSNINYHIDPPVQKAPQFTLNNFFVAGLYLGGALLPVLGVGEILLGKSEAESDFYFAKTLTPEAREKYSEKSLLKHANKK